MANKVNGITFEEYCNGMTAKQAKHEMERCQWNRIGGCEASSPGGVKCLMCENTSIPEGHPWEAETKAFRESA